MKIAVGGMIASGKSTLVKNLGETLGLPIMEEFEANDKVFNTLLSWLYTNEANVEMLLQVYFIHTHYLNQQKYGDNFIVDRDLIEHWLFAKKNLQHMPEVMNFYNGLFMAYMNKVTLPDLYIILDVTWDDFLSRIKVRGRDTEVNNLDQNIPYFKALHTDYLDKLVSQCNIYDIPYVIIDTHGKTEEQVLLEAKEYLKTFNKE